MKTYRVTVEVDVVIDIADDAPGNIITRCTENHDEQGVPRPARGGGWRDVLYPLETEEEVLEHLAFNAVMNGFGDISRLDGWADVEPGKVSMRIARNSMHVAYVQSP